MSEELSVQLLSQTSDNIQKLFDLSIRIDERLKAVSSSQNNAEKKVEDLIQNFNRLVERVVKQESSGDTALRSDMNNLRENFHEFEIRLQGVESKKKVRDDRKKKIWDFFIQLFWVVVASYVLLKLKLQPPGVP